MVSHILPSGVSLYSLTLSSPLVLRSPMRLALRGGHSTGPSVFPPAGGGSGVSRSGDGGVPVSTPPASGSS